MNSSNSVNIIGGGLAGSLMAVYMARKGLHVNVFERRPDMRKLDMDGGRSINLALSARGMHALRETGMLDEIMEIAIPMYGRMIHDLDGQTTLQPYSHDPEECIYSISRAELNKRLMNMSEALKRVDFYFSHRCEEVDFDSGKVILENLETGAEFEAPSRRTLACDGAFSAVRYAMQKTPRFNLSQHFLDHGYKELTIPPGVDGDFQMNPNALHIWPRGTFMMIALPNQDRSFTCTLFAPYGGEKGFDALKTPEQVTVYFEEMFPDAVPLIPDLLTDFFTNPTGSLVTIRCFPWVKRDKVALMGDASHAIVPFFGQGMNAAFEDCTVMNACIEKYGDDWEAVFEAYQKERKPNAEAIADMALENYIEMRDLTADPEFQFRKKVEHHLASKLAGYRSRYELVSFSRIPYAEAYKRGETNLSFLAQLMEGADQISEVNLEEAEALLPQFFS